MSDPVPKPVVARIPRILRPELRSLGKELKQLGIAVTAVEPGMFRTDWAGRSMTENLRLR